MSKREFAISSGATVIEYKEPTCIRYEWKGHKEFVEARVKGRTIEMTYDTGKRRGHNSLQFPSVDAAKAKLEQVAGYVLEKYT